MKYECGTEVMLGDELMVRCGPYGKALALVVAIGTDSAIAEIDLSFYTWAKDEAIINKETVVVEWIGRNPLMHDDPSYSSVGNYLTLESICCETFVRRGKGEK